MFSKLRTAALSAVIGLGAIAAMPAAAQADGLYLNFGGSHRDAGVGIYVGGRDGAHYRHNRYDRRDYRACTPHRAVNKAERMGVRRARVVDVDRRTIEVAGRKHGRRVHLTFGRAGHCPIVRW
ncbi:MAG: hypothetical protein KKB66_01025 [Alphaproteobacteria bacterium]|nr:hypothetical protein [Alphaproteobacteria bacterium]MBU0802950.1 hypothetical protein [Alphaproteobacteria bacterium]MBU0870939.1 hypothetical protein [Alphaproteobacteria bacterium]MBU1403390.1 hypothetical protein [Alphaproteobacteria bacterium]MBU1589726.1 hypothetical protein [Alphaproteobacteria bacterium]